jgi:hypothetical protein
LSVIGYIADVAHKNLNRSSGHLGTCHFADCYGQPENWPILKFNPSRTALISVTLALKASSLKQLSNRI